MIPRTTLKTFTEPRSMILEASAFESDFHAPLTYRLNWNTNDIRNTNKIYAHAFTRSHVLPKTVTFSQSIIIEAQPFEIWLSRAT